MITQEQQQVIDTILSKDSDDKIVTVNSVAGSGKTTTALEVVKALNPKNGFYTAFNRAIVEDSRGKFPTTIESKNIHAFAYKYVRPKKDILELSYTSIKETLTYADKANVIALIDGFYRSSYLDIYEYGIDKAYNQNLIDIAAKYAEAMLNNKIPPTYNFMLKYLHLMLAQGNMNIDYDIVLLDECQDTTEVTLEIFKLINAKKKIMLGDTYQNIYSFMDTVNGFERLKDTINLKLTKSFRCNPNIAKIVEEYGTTYLDEDFVFEGTEYDSSTNTEAYITRSNAALINIMHDLQQRNISFSLTRPIKEIFSLPLALINVNAGNPVFEPKYKFLEKEYRNYHSNINNALTHRSFYAYLNHVTEDIQIQNAITVIINFMEKDINIFDIKNKVERMRPNRDIIVTTAHAFKGLEADTVYINNDLERALTRSIITRQKLIERDLLEYMDSDTKENFNIYYVALTRARHELIFEGAT